MYGVLWASRSPDSSRIASPASWAIPPGAPASEGPEPELRHARMTRHGNSDSRVGRGDVNGRNSGGCRGGTSPRQRDLDELPGPDRLGGRPGPRRLLQGRERTDDAHPALGSGRLLIGEVAEAALTI